MNNNVKEGINQNKKEDVGIVKIFVSHHKEGEIVQDSVITPIHVGAAQSSTILNITRDDTGDNISAKNDRYCELTAQYWAWKNVNADYYGFMHYRRHFVFRDISDELGLGGVVEFPTLNENYKSYIGLTEGELYGRMQNYDIILPYPVDTSVWGTINNEVQFSRLENLHAKDFMLMCKTIVELFPEYQDAIDEFRKSSYSYWYNMFIFRKDIFFSYCEWLFAILERLESKINWTNFNLQETRTMAFMAERLLSIYLIKLLKDNPELKVRHLKMTFVENTEEIGRLKTAFDKNNIPIAVSCNEYYMPFLGVMLNSLLESASRDFNYEIFVMQNRSNTGDTAGIKRQKKMLKNLVAQYDNSTIRFIDISSIIGDKDFFVRDNFTLETYFRLFLPAIFDNCEKIIYLDADIVVCHDISEMYNIDLEDNLVGAVRDPIICGSAKSTEYNKKEYMEQLGIKNIYDYFQAGVLLLNIKKLSENNFHEQMIEYAATHDCDLVDQDVLNLFCQGRVKYIDSRWNVDVNPIATRVVPYAPLPIWQQYQKNRDNAYIYHFAGVDKPWKNPSLEYADVFWHSARKTPWYEMILEDLISAASFFKRAGTLYSAEANKKLIKWPSDIIETTTPIMKAHAELASVGLSKVVENGLDKFDSEFERLVSARHLMFYGAGNCCRVFLAYFDELGVKYPEVIWDRSAKPKQRLFNIPVVSPDFESMKGKDDTVCVITIESKSVTHAVTQSFKQNGFDNIIINEQLIKALSVKLWKQLNENNTNDCEMK